MGARRRDAARPHSRLFRLFRLLPLTAPAVDYKQAGVDYAKIDPLKILAQQAAASTTGHLARHGLTEVAASRGESAYVVDCGDFYLASITECLGTKALVADAMRAISGRTHYEQIAQDTLAMAINDLITVGATPVSVHAYWATGGSDWFDDAERARDLVAGWKAACDTCGVAWGGGETPALAGVVAPDRIDLAASCVGLVRPKSRLTLGEKLAAGDAIVLLASSGIHANGVSLARKLAEQVDGGYAARLDDGTRYGEALLAPTVLYSPVTEALAAAGTVPHYAVNVTGHGWRKLMRHPAAFTYRFHTAAAGAAGAALHPAAGEDRRSRGLRQPQHGRRLRAVRRAGRGRARGRGGACLRHRGVGGRPRRGRTAPGGDRTPAADLRRRRPARTRLNISHAVGGAVPCLPVASSLRPPATPSCHRR
jgi:phosphoribosylformylglycinamidine cyclo-ligase